MSETEDPIGRADDLVLALRRLRRLVGQRDRLPHDSRDRSALDSEIDHAQRETWRIASAWDEGQLRENSGQGDGHNDATEARARERFSG